MSTTTPGFARNKWAFGLGTLGRDMAYSLVAMYLIFFLTEVANLPDGTLWWTSLLMLGTRLFDAANDLVMGMIVDNTRTRWGAYKPWITVGMMLSSLLTVLLFVDLGEGAVFVTIFFLVYLAWSLAWTMNDIPYWALLPALTHNQREREQAGAIAKTAASIGLFTVVISIIPLTTYLGDLYGSPRSAWVAFAAMVVGVLILFQLVTLIGVQEPREVERPARASLKELWAALSGNDQMLWVSASMVVFMTGFITTTSFGTYYFKYVYGDESMYSIFALVIAVGQLGGFISFPFAAKRFSRKGLYTFSTVCVVAGYIVFFISPAHIAILAIAGLPLFFGDAYIVMLILMFLSDTVEYGQWKLGRRNTALTFSVQPFINKVGGALATQIVAVTVILSGINEATSPADVSPSGLWLMKVMMLVLPLVLVLIAYAIIRFKYTLDASRYARIITDLEARGEL